MAARASAQRRRSPKKRRAAPRSRRRLFWTLAVVFVAVFLYYRPLSSYVQTRHDLTAQRVELHQLRAQKLRLEQRLNASTSLEATRREARRLGYVRPGERLFIVKGIPEWLKARRSVGGHG